MSIYRITTNLPISTKIKLMNDMILELEGYMEQGRFNKNEIDSIFNKGMGLGRQFLRNQGVGNTTTTYTGWSHLRAEAGYSIWKYAPTSYNYNSVNELYMDNTALENRGEASSEAATAFDVVYLYDAETISGQTAYTNNTAESATEEGTEFELMDSTSDYHYMGLSTVFSGAKFEFKTRGSNYTLKVEYWSGTSWATMTANANNLEDGTTNFQGDGHITWDLPSDWGTNTVNSQSKYWVRISTTSTPVTTAEAYYIIPKNNVIGLLALSTTEIQNEDWAWCTLGANIYVTIRNAGNSNYEGNYYITSSSSATNKQNFFVYNKPITADYENSTYDSVATYTASGGIKTTDGVVLGNAAAGAITLTLPAAYDHEGKIYIIKKIDAVANVVVDTVSGETIDGAGTHTLGTQYHAITVVSDGANWHIIGELD